MSLGVPVMAGSGGATEGALQGCPWYPVCLSGHQLLAKAWFGETAYHVLLSDMRCVWEEKMDTASIQRRAQELNHRLRAPVEAFFSHLCEVARPCLSGQQAGGAQISLTSKQDSGVGVRLKSELAGLPFYWELHLSPAPVTLVCSQLVRPLLLMSRLLQRQVDDLGALLVRKDMEIQDYRENGATLTRERLQTDGYEEDRHTQAFIAKTLPQLCSGHQEGFGFTADLQDLYRTVVAHGNTHKRKLSESPTLEEDELTNQEPDRGPAPNTTLPTDVGSVSSEPVGEDQGLSQNGPGSRANDRTASGVDEKQSAAAPTERPSSRPKKKKAVGLFR